MWIDSLEGAPNTVRNVITALQALYAWAIPRGLARVNPTRDLRLTSPERGRRYRELHLDHAQIEAAEAAARAALAHEYGRAA